MRYAPFAFLPLLVLAAGWRHGGDGGSERQTTPTAVAVRGTSVQVRTPVLVELFTSEGCSSCPPADALLATLEEQQPVANAEIIALEEHVDYWDHQGWVDPFSGSQWTQRQEEYAAVTRDHGVYTPEMVVNGQAVFVGSHERQAYAVIAQLAAQAHLPIEITAINSDKRGEVHLHITAAKLNNTPANEHPEVWLAITETGLHSAVAGGENTGLDFHHSAVVRSLRKLGNAEPDKEPSFGGDPAVKIDKGWKRENLRVVVFVQEKRSRHVLGAASLRPEP